nr:acylphosphatase [Veillonella denticariosi]
MKKDTNHSQTMERWGGIRYTGIVQGVGFRPLVSMWAHSLQLSGFVYNDSHGVYVEIQGGRRQICSLLWMLLININRDYAGLLILSLQNYLLYTNLWSLRYVNHH